MQQIIYSNVQNTKYLLSFSLEHPHSLTFSSQNSKIHKSQPHKYCVQRLYQQVVFVIVYLIRSNHRGWLNVKNAIAE